MSKPSDFRPNAAIEVQQSAGDNTRLIRGVWALRVIGGVLLIAGWTLAIIIDPNPLRIAVISAVLAVLGVYAFAAAARARGLAVNLERKLRLGLLVHNMELESMAMQDDLTQLFNRRYFFDRLERELRTAKAFDRPLAVIVLDLDSMKAVNDTYGHRAGDELLGRFGRFLLDHTRASDVPARIGGDEFAIILPDTSENAGEIAMRRLSQKLENADLGGEHFTQGVSASIGMSGFPWGGDTVDAIIHKADAAMYQDKRERKVRMPQETNGHSVVTAGTAPGEAAS